MARKHLSDVLKEILEVTREWSWKSGRRGRCRGGREVAESESNAGSDGPWYSGTEIGDAQVGG